MFCIVIFLTGSSLLEAMMVFGTAGTLISFLVYRYLQNVEYYFYGNAGFSAKALQVKTLLINLVVAAILILLLWIIHLK